MNKQSNNSNVSGTRSGRETSRSTVEEMYLGRETNPFSYSYRKFISIYRFKPLWMETLIYRSVYFIKERSIPLQVRIFAALYFFLNGRYHCTVNGASKKMQMRNVIVVAKFLKKISKYWVKFPSKAELSRIKERFSEKTHFPFVVGCIDNHRFEIKKPFIKKNRSQYFNEDNRYTLSVQLITNYDLNILYATPSEGIAAKGCKILNNYPAIRALRKNKDQFSWLLADSEYQLCKWVLTPYTEANKTKTRKVFNQVHGKARNANYRLYHSLKANFRCLQYIDASPAQARLIIDACIVLHNMLVAQGIAITDENVNNHELICTDKHQNKPIDNKCDNLKMVYKGMSCRNKANNLILENLDFDDFI